MNTIDFINKAKEIHRDKYDYSKVEYVSSQKKICIICPKHGEFWQRPNDHLNGHGCKKCAVEKKSEESRCDTNSFIEKCKKIHDNKYDYSKTTYINNHTNVQIICPKHGEFQIRPNNHLNGQGCPICGRLSAAEKLKKKTSMFIDEARRIHENKYDYSKVEYKNNMSKVCIICPEHGEFWQVPSAHLRGQGCPDCNNSTLEREVYNILSGMSISNERYSNINGLLGKQSVDFYLDKENVAIECQGIQHFIDTELYKETLEENIERDIRKKELCECHGITIKYYIRESIIKKYDILNNKKYRNIYNQNNIIYA